MSDAPASALADARRAVPRGVPSSVPFGILVHFGPSVALVAAAAATDFAPVPTILGFSTFYEDRSLSPAFMVKHHIALPIVPRGRG